MISRQSRSGQADNTRIALTQTRSVNDNCATCEHVCEQTKYCMGASLPVHTNSGQQTPQIDANTQTAHTHTRSVNVNCATCERVCEQTGKDCTGFSIYIFSRALKSQTHTYTTQTETQHKRKKIDEHTHIQTQNRSVNSRDWCERVMNAPTFTSRVSTPWGRYILRLPVKRSTGHTHIQRERTTPPTPIHTHTTRTTLQTPKRTPPTNTSQRSKVARRRCVPPPTPVNTVITNPVTIFVVPAQAYLVQERAAYRLYYLSAKIVQSVSGSLLYLT